MIGNQLTDNLKINIKINNIFVLSKLIKLFSLKKS